MTIANKNDDAYSSGHWSIDELTMLMFELHWKESCDKCACATLLVLLRADTKILLRPLKTLAVVV